MNDIRVNLRLDGSLFNLLEAYMEKTKVKSASFVIRLALIYFIKNCDDEELRKEAEEQLVRVNANLVRERTKHKIRVATHASNVRWLIKKIEMRHGPSLEKEDKEMIKEALLQEAKVLGTEDKVKKVLDDYR